MNYDQIFAFVVFAEQLNFTRAAKLLNLSQPALHVQIKKLSETVGVPLYVREGKVLSLTNEGAKLAAFGREQRERGHTLLEDLRGQSFTGPLVLASGQGAFLYLLGPAIRRFPKSKWPLRLLTQTGADAIESVRKAHAQLCVVAIENQPTDLESARLCTLGHKVILPAHHRLAKRKSLKAEDLAAEPLIVGPPGSPHRAMLARLVRASGHDLQVAVEATGWELMLQFARVGLGVAVVNDFCPTPRGTVAIPFRGAPEVTYYLLARPGPHTDAAEAMRQLIVETVRN